MGIALLVMFVLLVVNAATAGSWVEVTGSLGGAALTAVMMIALMLAPDKTP